MDLICFSHLRWNFVYQRPQHLLSRFVNHYRVFYIEEPVDTDFEDSYCISTNNDNVWIVTLRIKKLDKEDIIARQRKLLNQLFTTEEVKEYIFWYYTPMSLQISDHFKPKAIVYDCMDELSAFKYANPLLKDLEKQLFKKAHIVFTGGKSLYQAKKDQHHNVHLFPSSIDKEHFSKARLEITDPVDQKHIPHPRLGFFGVIDERFDIGLIEKAAVLQPEWHFIFIGPVVKIDPETLPKRDNIHYLGNKAYELLPEYVSGWDIALIPFALNESTRYISPTKTPEYLSAGKPVISTAIHDVVDPYGEKKLVHIVNNVEEFIQAGSKEIHVQQKDKWLAKVDQHLANNSWSTTWFKMHELIKNELYKQKEKTEKEKNYV